MAKTKSNPKTAAKPKKSSANNPKEAMPAASPARTSMAPGVDIGISDRDRKATRRPGANSCRQFTLT